MRMLKTAVIAMTVLIIGATALLATLIVRRLSQAALPPGTATLHEPPGTQLIGITTTQAGLVLALHGAGPDRLLILDPHTLKPTAHIVLTPSNLAPARTLP